MEKITYTLLLITTAFFMASCNDVKIPEPGKLDAGPELVSSTPADGAARLANGDMTIVLTYNQNVFCPTVGHSSITLGDATITSVVADLTKVTIKATGIKEATAYQLVVPENVVLGPTKLGAPQVTINFSTRGIDPVVATLCSPNPTQEAVNLYKYLVENYRKKVISGTMANVNWNIENAEAVYTLTGKYPAMNTFDYIHLYASSDEPGSWINYSDITPVKNWWDANGLVSIMWHWNVPTHYVDSEERLWPTEVVEMPDDWSGNIELTANGGYDINALFGTAQVGDKVIVRTLDVLAGAQGSFKSSDWAAIADEYAYPDITGDYEMEITADILAKLQSGGLIISGHDYTVSAVTLESGGISTALWGELPMATGGWINNLQLTADGGYDVSELFSNAKAGSKIVVKVTDLLDGSQGSLKDTNWGEIAAGYEYFDIDGDYEMVITADIQAKLQSGGLNIGGNNYSIKAVYLIGGGYSDTYAFYNESIDNEEPKTSFDAANATVDGTWENEVFTADLAKVVTSLKQLQDEGIAVIWRPFHEAAGGWFWWGKDAASFKQNWIAMFDYFAAEGVNNLIWVWTTETKDEEWYPGDAYVDIIGRDLYSLDAEKVTEQYFTVDDVYSNRIISLSECGTLGLISEQWAAGSRWSWFMPWYGNNSEGKPHGTDEWWIDAMEQEYVITRGDVPQF